VPEYTRPATWEDLKRLAKLLNEAQAEYALVGGYAIASHGFSRQSEDIDLLVNPTAENSRRWIVALSQLPDQATRVLEQEPDVFALDHAAIASSPVPDRLAHDARYALPLRAPAR
jgi:hypothetical protein